MQVMVCEHCGKEVEEASTLIVTSAEAMAEDIANRIHLVLEAWQPVLAAARTHAAHDRTLLDALEFYDASCKSTNVCGSG
jgi:hypothetical protein